MAEKFISKNFQNRKPLDATEVETVKTEIENKLNNLQPDDIDGVKSSDILWEPNSVPEEAVPDEILDNFLPPPGTGDFIQDVPNLTVLSTDPLAVNAGFVAFNRLYAHDPFPAGSRVDIGYIAPIIFGDKFGFIMPCGALDQVRMVTVHGGDSRSEVVDLLESPINLPAGARPVHAFSTLDEKLYIACTGDTDADCKVYQAGNSGVATLLLDANNASLPSPTRSFGLRKMYCDRTGKFLYALSKSTSGGPFDTVLRISTAQPGTDGETDAYKFSTATDASKELVDIAVSHPDPQNPGKAIVYVLQKGNGTTGVVHALEGNDGTTASDWQTPPTVTSTTNPTGQSGEVLWSMVLNDDGSLWVLGDYASGIAWAMMNYDVAGGWAARFTGNSTATSASVLPGSGTRDQRAFYAMLDDAKVVRWESGDADVLLMTPTNPWPSAASEKSNIMFCGRTCIAHVSNSSSDGTSVAFKL